MRRLSDFVSYLLHGLNLKRIQNKIHTLSGLVVSISEPVEEELIYIIIH